METQIGQLARERDKLTDELMTLRERRLFIDSREAVVRSKIASYDREIEQLMKGQAHAGSSDKS
jgi:uncharacterized coiled-coil DUF342 family protein